VTPYGVAAGDQCFGGPYCLYLQGEVDELWSIKMGWRTGFRNPHPLTTTTTTTTTNNNNNNNNNNDDDDEKANCFLPPPFIYSLLSYVCIGQRQFYKTSFYNEKFFAAVLPAPLSHCGNWRLYFKFRQYYKFVW
jgi:hypothetical protein